MPRVCYTRPCHRILLQPVHGDLHGVEGEQHNVVSVRLLQSAHPLAPTVTSSRPRPLADKGGLFYIKNDPREGVVI